MLIYSETSFAFIRKCEQYLKDILKNETDLNVRRNRFEYNRYLYPIHVVVFDGTNKLGFFDPHTYQIGLNQSLMYSTKEKVLKDIIRHEVAHYLSFIENPYLDKPHGHEFKQICNRYHWPQDVSKASAHIEDLNQNIEGDLQAEKLIEKVKKLLKLAQSDNEHESQMATMKANQLLLKYNLNLYQENQFETLYVDKVITQKRKSSKLMAIYDLLKHFMVRPILSYGKGQVSLEVTGSKANIELAKYLASFLDHELERLWNQEKERSKLKGLKAKNSYFFGLAKGYDQKMQKSQNDFTQAQQKDLMVINNQLDKHVSKIYRRLSSTSSSGSIDNTSFGAGERAGKNLNINKGIKNKNKSKLLGWLR